MYSKTMIHVFAQQLLMEHPPRLTTLVITVNGDGFSRISIFKDYLGLFVAGVHRVARSHRDREGGAGCAKGIRWKEDSPS